MILVADSGSTKTDWAAIGDTVQRFQSIGLNPLFFTDESLETTISGALADVAAEEVTGVYFYGSGCGLEVNRNACASASAVCSPMSVRSMWIPTW